MTSQAFGFLLPAGFFNITNVQIQGERGSQIGIKMTNALVITDVNIQSISHMKLMIGDVISSVNGQKIESRSQFAELYGKISQSGPTFNIDVVMQRPIISMPVKPSQIPRGYEIITGCKYHVGVMYKIPGCKLSLSIKAYMSKIYVTRTEDGTLAGLSLKIGDAILDIEGQAVSTVQETSEYLFKALKSKGYATMVIEQPTELINKNIVRQALIADRTTEMAPQKDVALICKNELKRFMTNSDLPPNKEILSKKKSELGHVQINQTSEDIPIACDGNPNLLIPVPQPNFQIQSQQGPLQSTTQK